MKIVVRSQRRGEPGRRIMFEYESVGPTVFARVGEEIEHNEQLHHVVRVTHVIDKNPNKCRVEILCREV